MEQVWRPRPISDMLGGMPMLFHRRRPKILGHRGFSARYPENTRLSFTQAIEAGADGIECDVQLTGDGEPVILHDPSLQRTAGREGQVNHLTWAELASVRLGIIPSFAGGGSSSEGQPILRLEDLLDLIPRGRWLNIEIKRETVKPADCPRLADLIVRKRGTDRILISSFAHKLLPAFRARGLITAQLVGESHARFGTGRFVGLLLKTRPDYVNLPLQLFERLGDIQGAIFVWTLRLLRFKISFWTVNEESGFRKICHHSDFVITDEVQKALEWRDRKSASAS